MFSSAEVARGGSSGDRVQDLELSLGQPGLGNPVPRDRGFGKGAFREYLWSTEFIQSHSASASTSHGTLSKLHHHPETPFSHLQNGPLNIAVKHRMDTHVHAH